MHHRLLLRACAQLHFINQITISHAIMHASDSARLKFFLRTRERTRWKISAQVSEFDLTKLPRSWFNSCKHKQWSCFCERLKASNDARNRTLKQEADYHRPHQATDRESESKPSADKFDASSGSE
jgi:hypothetical protein